GGKQPNAFRAGRWGIGTPAIAALLACGYRVDSSVTPYTSWSDYGDGPSHFGAPVTSYRVDPVADIWTPVADGPLIEIPASFGFNRAPLQRWGRIHRALSSRVGRSLLLNRVAGATGLVR